MGIFDIFNKKAKLKENITSLKVGDWVTQYSAGYWQVTHIFPKYADSDYSYNGVSCKKGDHISEWVVLKKGFTAKMKPSNACDFVDAQVCRLVSDDIAKSIQTAFAENPKAKQKFDSASNMPNPSLENSWLKLTEEQAETFAVLIDGINKKFSSKQFWSEFADWKKYVVDPSKATHILHLYSYLWEIDDNFEPLHFGAELAKL